jgi:hypothetical protein
MHSRRSRGSAFWRARPRADVAQGRPEFSTLNPTTLRLRAGPFAVSLTTDIQEVLSKTRLLYPPTLFLENGRFVDFQIGVRRGRGARRWVRPRAVFEFDQQQPFKPLPLDQALPMFEWGLNYVIAGTAHWYGALRPACRPRGARYLGSTRTADQRKASLRVSSRRLWFSLNQAMCGTRVWIANRSTSRPTESACFFRIEPEMASPRRGALSHAWSRAAGSCPGRGSPAWSPRSAACGCWSVERSAPGNGCGSSTRSLRPGAGVTSLVRDPALLPAGSPRRTRPVRIAPSAG